MYTYVHKIYMYMIYIYMYMYIYIHLLISSKCCKVVTVFDCSPAPFTRLNKLKCVAEIRQCQNLYNNTLQ